MAMLPQGKRRSAGKAVVKGDVSDLTSDVAETSEMPLATASDISSGDELRVGSGRAKRRKPGSKRGSPALKGESSRPSGGMDVGEVDEVLVSALSSVGQDSERPLKAKKAKAKKAKALLPQPEANAAGVIGDMKAISSSLAELVLEDGVGKAVGRKILSGVSRFETLLMGLIAENERLRGRLDGVGADAVLPRGFGAVGAVDEGGFPVVAGGVAASGGFVEPAGPAPAVEYPPLPAKPVETWSVVVKGKEGATSAEVVDKVEKEVAPTLGVRVHAIRPMRGGGAVIRTPSVVEREKIANSSKFAEIGLEVSVKDKLGPRVVVQGVHGEISTDDFMEDLYEMNLKDDMSARSFKRSVRLVSAPWKTGTDGKLNVILEVTDGVMEKLTAGGVYIKWFRFIARAQDPVRACFRCLGFDHEVRRCRVAGVVCRQCGMTGHSASRCQNPARCRNCALKGWPAGHMMLSTACPIVASKVAAANARH